MFLRIASDSPMEFAGVDLDVLPSLLAGAVKLGVQFCFYVIRSRHV
jgi:hypothetical protein